MKRLIINADDLGYDPAVTEGILLALKIGVVSSTTFMVNTPFSEVAANAARDFAVGLHLNLARHAPLSTPFPAQWLLGGELSEAKASELPVEVVAQETRAQLHRLERLLGKPATHIDVHKHLHQHPNVLEGMAQAALEEGLAVRSIHPQMRKTLLALGVRTNPHFIGEAGVEPYWTLERLEAELARLPDGVTELMCHPGRAPSHVKSGYAGQRELELATFTAHRARELLEEQEIQLVDFRAV